MRRRPRISFFFFSVFRSRAQLAVRKSRSLARSAGAASGQFGPVTCVTKVAPVVPLAVLRTLVAFREGVAFRCRTSSSFLTARLGLLRCERRIRCRRSPARPPLSAFRAGGCRSLIVRMAVIECARQLPPTKIAMMPPWESCGDRLTARHIVEVAKRNRWAILGGGLVRSNSVYFHFRSDLSLGLSIRGRVSRLYFYGYWRNEFQMNSDCTLLRELTLYVPLLT